MGDFMMKLSVMTKKQLVLEFEELQKQLERRAGSAPEERRLLQIIG